MTEREMFQEAVMQHLVDDAQVKRESKRRKTHPVARKIMFAAACVLVAASVTVFSIPSARAAVEEWISGWFSMSDYFGLEKNDRTKEPTIEAIITSAGENRAKVTKIGKGYEAYAEGFDMTLDEIAYDGETVFVSGTMSGATARPFVEAQTGGDTFRAEKYAEPIGSDIYGQYCFCACETFAKFETTDGLRFFGEVVPRFTEEMDAIAISQVNKEKEVVFENGELVTSNKEADALWDAYLADHDVRFSIELEYSGQETLPLSGQVSGELSFWMRYLFVDGVDTIPLLEASFGTITLDATVYQEYTKTSQAKAGTSVTLGGVHPVTITEWQPQEEWTSDDCEVYYSTHELDFTGASFSLKEITFTPTDTKITLHVVIPETWTVAERANANLQFHFLVDGKPLDAGLSIPFNVCGPFSTYDPTGATLEYDCRFYESSLSPSQWASMKTLTIIPTTGYWWEMDLSFDNGPFESYSLQKGAVVTTYANRTSMNWDELYDEMTQYALIINLDDYR